MTKWTTACPDWEERIVARETLVPSGPMHPSKAEEALGVFKSLQMTDMPMRRDGTWPTMGEVCEPFVFDLVAAMFGAQDPDTGASGIKEAMLLISKKNGKSTIAAGIMLTALILNWRYDAELLVLAPTIEIANNSFGPAAAMVRADPELTNLLHVIDNQRQIKHRVNRAVLKIVAADTGVVGGKKAGFVLVDELWIFGKRAGSDAMLEEATGGQASRPEGFTIYLTTHSDEPPAGVFKSKLAYFRDVRDGEIEDPTCLPMLYEWPESMIVDKAYLDPENFYVTNPNIGKSQSVAFIQRKIAQAEAGEGEEGDTTIQIVIAKYLNVEIGLRRRRDRWLGADYWEQAKFEPLRDLDELLRRSEVAVVGIDGGGLDDLAGLCVLGRDRVTSVWLYWFHAWAHRKVLEVRKAIAAELQGFSVDGDLTFWGDAAQPFSVAQRLSASGETEEFLDRTDGANEDYSQMVDICVRVRERGLFPENGGIGLDPAVVGALLDALEAREFSLVDGGKGNVELISQSTVNMFSAINALQRRLESGSAAHGGSAMMAWCVSNAKAIQRGNALAITKQEAGRAKIDPLVAGFIATKMMERNPVASNDNGRSVYEEREMVVL